jgi:hypothetical protein
MALSPADFSAILPPAPGSLKTKPDASDGLLAELVLPITWIVQQIKERLRGAIRAGVADLRGDLAGLSAEVAARLRSVGAGLEGEAAAVLGRALGAVEREIGGYKIQVGQHEQTLGAVASRIEGRARAMVARMVTAAGGATGKAAELSGSVYARTQGALSEARESIGGLVTSAVGEVGAKLAEATGATAGNLRALEARIRGKIADATGVAAVSTCPAARGALGAVPTGSLASSVRGSAAIINSAGARIPPPPDTTIPRPSGSAAAAAAYRAISSDLSVLAFLIVGAVAVGTFAFGLWAVARAYRTAIRGRIRAGGE